jgi:hypothetical protein
MRRRAVVLMTAVAVVGALAIGTEAMTAGASVASKKAPACAGKTKKAAIKAIKLAYDYFLDGAKYPNSSDKEPFIEMLSGAKLNAALKTQFEQQATAQASSAATTSVLVKKVTCTGKSKANVAYDLVLGGKDSPGIAPPGSAVIDGGVWKVTAKALCDLEGLGDPSLLQKDPCQTIETSG